jgi:tetratricopeptide (TPR) repeat protein
LLDDHPHWSDLWQLLGRCQQERGQDAESIVSLTVAIAERPTAYERYLDRGLAFARLGRLESAFKDFDRCVRLNPGFAHGFSNRGMVLAKMGDHRAAVADFSRAIELWPRQPKFWFLRADAKRSLNDVAGAEEDETKGRNAVPNDAEGWVALALRRLDADPAGALRDLDEALKLDAHCRDALQNKAAAYDRLNRPVESLAALNLLLASNPDYSLGLAGRCVLLARQGNAAAARRDAERAIAVDPSPGIQYQVAGCYALLGRKNREDVDTAFRFLAAALRSGFGQELLDDDPDLEPIRRDPRFVALKNSVRQISQLERPIAKESRAP